MPVKQMRTGVQFPWVSCQELCTQEGGRQVGSISSGGLKTGIKTSKSVKLSFQVK